MWKPEGAGKKIKSTGTSRAGQLIENGPSISIQGHVDVQNYRTSSIRYFSLSTQPLFNAFRLTVTVAKAIFTFMIVGLLFSDEEKAMSEIFFVIFWCPLYLFC